MRAIMMTVAVLALVVPALAQDKPPMVGDRPLTQVKPRGGKAAPPKPASMATRLQACTEIDDETKERLDCYDAVIAPKPAAGKRKLPPAKSVADCRLIADQEERLGCFNGFASKLPKPAG